MERFDLWKTEEYGYPKAFGFMPHIYTMLHEDGGARPAMIVVPGGAYRVVSPTEGELVAKTFYEKGYQAFVCVYTTNTFDLVPPGRQPLQDLSRAVRLVRSRAAEWKVDPHRVYLCGFSAGGHLCGSLTVHYEDVRDPDPALDAVANRPDAAILSYPVITSGEYAHRDSFVALLGPEASESDLAYFSLEKHVKADTPPCFLWQTATDELVPVENSCLMAKALKEKGVPFAHHIFSGGAHGLSLANEAWAKGEFGSIDTMEQTRLTARALLADGDPEDAAARVRALAYLEFEKENQENQAPRLANAEAAVWPCLAAAWLDAIRQERS